MFKSKDDMLVTSWNYYNADWGDTCRALGALTGAEGPWERPMQRASIALRHGATQERPSTRPIANIARESLPYTLDALGEILSSRSMRSHCAGEKRDAVGKIACWADKN